MNAIRIAAGGAIAMLVIGLLSGMDTERGRPAQTPSDEEKRMSDIKKPEKAELNEKAGLVAAPAHETAILAGGCFWGMEEILRKIPGVLDTAVGYSGGTTENPTYSDVCSGDTGHAEAIRVEFDSARLTYEELLNYFFRMHDPTTPNRQHNDVGTQYRSAIFYTSEIQRKTAEDVKARWDKSGKFRRPVVTEVTRAGAFHPAEEYHQKYLVKNPGGYTCHVLRD